ncbi:hypothetical protein AB0C29_45435 [Actinoplanes sp. NPDC048791]|uniref:hypothetical protein n=1 Tax=Actinoplanes sp. NPDC048791 TaxID=3154623 RepID=UPI0033D3D817
MSIGSLSSSTVSTATLASADTAGQAVKAQDAENPTIADHVAAADVQEPIRSVSTTLGTLVDTYL